MKIRQSGFLGFHVAGYTVLILGTIVLGLSIALKIQSARLDSEKVDHANTKAKMVLWMDTANACSKATEEAKKQADRKAREAQDALKVARRWVVAKDAEIARLRAAKASGACPAGEAVANIRKGLK